VRHIARLANLEFGDAEQERFTRQLSDILEHVETLNRLDTGAVEPTAHAGGDSVLLRDDLLQPTLDRDAALEVAPDADRGLIKVPRVLG
jgi:aspartyl-tRNA(Asn)/glutamyl-tRNA(Gln) amidotransferase subunit C